MSARNIGLGSAVRTVVLSARLLEVSRKVVIAEEFPWFEDAIAVLGACRNEPGIARIEPDRLSLDRQLRSTRYDIADRLVITPDCTLVLRRLITPQAHGDPLTRREIHLPHPAFRRELAADLLDCGICHWSLT